MKTLHEIRRRMMQDDSQQAFLEQMFQMGAISAEEQIDAMESLKKDLENDIERIILDGKMEENMYQGRSL